MTGPTININELPPSGAAAAIMVTLQGFDAGAEVTLVFFEDDTEDSLIPQGSRSIAEIGRITGTLHVVKQAGNQPALLSLNPTKVVQKPPPAGQPRSKSKLQVVFEKEGGGSSVTKELDLPAGPTEAFEGDDWEIFITLEIKGQSLEGSSPTTRISRSKRALSVDHKQVTYNHYHGNIVNFYKDGASDPSGQDGYFHDLRNAIADAEHFVFIADWSFHPTMRTFPNLRPRDDNTFGTLLAAQARAFKDMVIAIHTWNHTGAKLPVVGVVAAFDPENDNGDSGLDQLTKSVFKEPSRPPNLKWRASSRKGFGFSHHQKFAVMDSPGPDGRRLLKLFMGGLDITKGRFDWGDHVILPDEPNASVFMDRLVYVANGTHSHDDWYNAEFFPLNAPLPSNSAGIISPTLPRQPWHDIACMINGPAAWDVVREFVGRWMQDPSSDNTPGDDGEDDIKLVVDLYKRMLNQLKDPKKPHHPKNNPRVFAQQWEPAIGRFTCQILRSITRPHWEDKNATAYSNANGGRKEFKWTHNGDSEASIMRSYINSIENAEKYIYIETQYFITGGSMWGRQTVANPLALNLGNRAGAKGKANEPFHIYLIIPMFPEGDPNSGVNKAQRQFQWASIHSMAKRMSSESGKPSSSLLSVFFLAKWRDLGGLPAHGTDRADNVRQNKRYMIYVHSKYMMIDDRFAIIGSANLNERSLNGGRDSEIAVGIWPSNDKDAAEVVQECTKFRMSLLREHLGPAFDKSILADLSSPAAIKHIRDAATENYRAFREGRFDATKHGHLCLWPQAIVDNVAINTSDRSKAPEGDEFLPDMPSGLTGKDKSDWQWDPPGEHTQVVSMTKQGADTAE